MCVLFSCCTVTVGEDTPADAAVVVEEVGNGNDSSLLVSRVPLTELQQNGIPKHTTLRDNLETIKLPHLPALIFPAVPNGSVEPTKPQLSDCDLKICTSQQEKRPNNQPTSKVLPLAIQDSIGWFKGFSH